MTNERQDAKPLSADEIAELFADPRLVHLHDARRVMATIAARDAEIERLRLGESASDAKALQWKRVDEFSEFCGFTLIELWTTKYAGEDAFGWWVYDADSNAIAEDMETRHPSREAARGACIAAARSVLREALEELGEAR